MSAFLRASRGGGTGTQVPVPLSRGFSCTTDQPFGSDVPTTEEQAAKLRLIAQTRMANQAGTPTAIGVSKTGPSTRSPAAESDRPRRPRPQRDGGHPAALARDDKRPATSHEVR